MNVNTKVALIFVIAALAVPTGYFALQFWNAVAHYEINWSVRVQTESELTAYVISIIDIWVITFEILAIAIIIQGRKAEGAPLSHDRMFEIIYALQGFGFFAALFWGLMMTFLIPPPPPSGFRYVPLAPGLLYLILGAIAFSISAVSFLAAYGFLRKRSWAKKVAFSLSLPSMLLWSCLVYGFMRTWLVFPTMFYLSLIFLVLALAVANAIVVFVLVWRYMIARKAR